MVRRLPVLQSGPQQDPPLGVSRAVLLSVPAVLLVFAPLLWVVRYWGAAGVAVAYLASCAVGAAVLGHRVRPDLRSRFGLFGALSNAIGVWVVAVFGSTFETAAIAAAALIALSGLGGAGFALGIFGLFRRQRATGVLRH